MSLEEIKLPESYWEPMDVISVWDNIKYSIFFLIDDKAIF